MKLYELALFIILDSSFGFFVSAVDRATDGGKKPLTKEAFIAQLEPIESANHDRYND